MVIPQFWDEREPLALLLTFFSFTRKPVRWNKAKATMMGSQELNIKNPHVFSPADELPKHARAPLSNAHWTLLKVKPTGLPLETGNTRRKKGRSVGVKRRSDIVKRGTELNMLAWERKRVYSFSPNNDSTSDEQGAFSLTVRILAFRLHCFLFYFILSTHASDGRCVALRF